MAEIQSTKFSLRNNMPKPPILVDNIEGHTRLTPVDGMLQIDEADGMSGISGHYHVYHQNNVFMYRVYYDEIVKYLKLDNIARVQS